MSNRTITIVFTIAVLAIVAIALALATNARAEVAPTFRSWGGQWVWAPEGCEHCRRIREYRRRQRARERRRQEEYRERHTRKVWRDEREYRIEHRDDRHERHSRRGVCYDEIRKVGEQWASEEGAQKEADKAFAAEARFLYGERVMSKEHAKDVRYECTRSSIGSVVGQVFYRCRIYATPCSPPVQRGN